MTRDRIAHSSVQAWSAGPIFPAVIAVVERDTTDGYCVPFRSYELTIGAFREEYATREDAEAVARWACRGGRIIPERYAELIAPTGVPTPYNIARAYLEAGRADPLAHADDDCEGLIGGAS